jgi:hypothetical protein
LPECTFAHEHGDDPATSTIYDQVQVPFGYVAAQMMPPMIEPHAGFKCHVVNKGTINDEGTVAINDSYFCFHMGTSSPGRFTQSLHSEVFHVKTNDGALMRLQGMADTGGVGTICDTPRMGKTVLGLGCLVNSSYEIWQNVLTVRNEGRTVASAITSTAVFDPITVYDPINPQDLIYSWSERARPLFVFDEDRSYYRDCDREAYHGPLVWNNGSGSSVYKTDAMGNVRENGTLSQQVSTVEQSAIMGYKGGNMNDPQTQFKMHTSFCGPGLGLLN